LKRIRFTTSHPKDLSQDLIRCFEEVEHLCPHIHLPFQAGSDRILKKMNRGYTASEYVTLITRLRATRPDIAITSDVMVGFPGETGEDFEKTIELIKHLEFDNLYSFKYSDRKGTRAAQFSGKVEEAEKIQRLTELQALQRSITLNKNRALKGCQVQVLVEGESRKGEQWTGRTASNKIVNFNHDNNILYKLVDVLIENVSVNSLQGKFKRINEPG
jgi:tRNA-2-methylthio-N6-dimethylallyladenosine synthase